MRSGPTRMMIYCQDSFGLGHLRRNVNIAHEVSRRAPDTTILFVADSPMAPFFELPRNSDFVKLPTLVKVSHGGWQAHRLPQLGADRMLGIRSQLIREVALSFGPDVLLVDHMPHGARGELVACLEALQRHCSHTRIVLGLRDILGAPEDILPQWRARGAFELLAEHYDAVLVYGSRGHYDLAAAYAFPPEVERLVRYCGYVATRKRRFPKAAARLQAELRGDRQFTALVMGGGGNDAHFFMDVVLEAIRSLGEAVPFQTFLLTGPFMPADERKALEAKAQGLPVVVRRFRDDSTKILQIADVVISMAGYNTACEILRFARAAVVIPREGPSAEQSMRARILHERGLVHAIHPRELTPEVLARAILEQLRGPRRPPAETVDLEGSRRASEIVLGLARASLAERAEQVA
jgi:predicted glycosyltransferase